MATSSVVHMVLSIFLNVPLPTHPSSWSLLGLLFWNPNLLFLSIYKWVLTFFDAHIQYPVVHPPLEDFIWKVNLQTQAEALQSILDDAVKLSTSSAAKHLPGYNLSRDKKPPVPVKIDANGCVIASSKSYATTSTKIWTYFIIFESYLSLALDKLE